MNWFTPKLNLDGRGRDENQLRHVRDSSLSNVEQLEDRLCLGTLTAPPMGDSNGIAAFNEPIIAPETSLLLVSSEVDLLLQPLDDQNREETPLIPRERVSISVVDNTSGFQLADPGPPLESIASVEVQTNALVDVQVNTVVEVQLSSEIGPALPAIPIEGVDNVDPDPLPQPDGGLAIADESQSVSSQPVVAGAVANAASNNDAPISANTEAVFQPQESSAAVAANSIDSNTLSSLGFTLDAEGNATATQPWWTNYSEPIDVKYDFRDVDGFENLITGEQQERAVEALDAWSAATGGMIRFERDTTSSDSEILNIGTGDLAAFGYVSGVGGTIAVGGGIQLTDGESPGVRGVAWLDQAENWDTQIGNGNPAGTLDYFTAVAHEAGHAIGFADSNSGSSDDIMNGQYDVERSVDSIGFAVDNGTFDTSFFQSNPAADIDVTPMVTGFPQLVEADVAQLLNRAAAASASNDAIIAVVDRGGNILGVRVEADALANIPDEATLVFAIDGAVAKARSAAFFSNGDPANGTLAPLTSRLVQFLSQSTVTQREVESNPNAEIDPMTGLRTVADVNASTTFGPGFVAPIGLGAHFPPGVEHTPPVDLFAIEHTNRDSLINPGADGIKGTPDDIVLPARFNVNPAFVDAGQQVNAPESYGTVSGRLPNAQSRGVGTLPGGIGIFRDTNGDGVGETLVGGIGVFFPGNDGFATYEQGFVPGVGQTTLERLNASRVLEAEFIAFAAVGGSQIAQLQGIRGAQIGALNGVAPVANIDLPFGRLDLVGINLPVLGPVAGREGVIQLLQVGRNLGVGDPNSGANQPLEMGATERDGQSVPEGFLVNPHDSATGNLNAQDVQQIIQQGVDAALLVRAAVRLPISSRTRMVFAVSDLDGEILGLFRMQDATFFSIDVAVAKARNTAYYADATTLDPFDQVVDAGTALTNRTFRFLAGPRFPNGVDGTPPGPFSILNNPSIDVTTGENLGGPAAAGTFDPAVNPNTASVLGFDAFFPNTNFQDSNNPENQNGIVFFPGSVPIYKNGVLVGGFGVSGDGVDQDDVVTFFGAQGFEAPNALRADQTFVRDVRLPYDKFLRNPFG